MYDLIVLGARVIDPSQNLDGRRDIGIIDGLIAAVQDNIPQAEGRQVIDAAGKIVTPGLIDLHSHVYYAFCLNGIHPDTVGVASGVTTVVDAGSAGSSVFGGFPEYVVPSAATDIYCFLNIARTGLLTTPEIISREDIDTDGTKQIVAQNRDLIRGIKLRATGIMADTIGPEIVTLAKQVSSELRLPLMVHIGQMEPRAKSTLIKEVLEALGENDILSHVYTGRPGGVLEEDGGMLRELKSAVQRGVFLDVGHGRSNISFAVARRLLEEGFLPHIISSDLILRHLGYPTYGSLTEFMSQFLAMELTLNQIVQMTTANPAKALGMEGQLGTLNVGCNADISILQSIEGDWKFTDITGNTIKGDVALVPAMSVKKGKPFAAELSPRFTKYLWPDRYTSLNQ
jgi:dihydroorotase